MLPNDVAIRQLSQEEGIGEPTLFLGGLRRAARGSFCLTLMLGPMGGHHVTSSQRC